MTARYSTTAIEIEMHSASSMGGPRREQSALDYLQRVSEAYEGEITGQVFFSQMAAHHADDTYAERAFLLLMRLEQRTGEILAAVLIRHGVPVPQRDKAAGIGRSVADAMSGLPWDEVVVAMAKRIGPAVVSYDLLAFEAPHSDVVEIGLLVDHEHALEAFVTFKPTRSYQALAPVIQCLRATAKYANTLRSR
jgi:hypothetical protein